MQSSPQKTLTLTSIIMLWMMIAPSLSLRSLSCFTHLVVCCVGPQTIDFADANCVSSQRHLLSLNLIESREMANHASSVRAPERNYNFPF